MSDAEQCDPEDSVTGRERPPLDNILPASIDISKVRGGHVENKKTHRWLSIPEQPPIDLGEPFMLLDLTCPTLASQSRELVLVK